MDESMLIGIGIALGVLILLIVVSYVKTSPNQALVISGWPRRNPKYLIGTGGLRIPGLQKVDRLYLGQLPIRRFPRPTLSMWMWMP